MNRKSGPWGNRDGFSLVETVAAMGIGAILVGICCAFFYGAGGGFSRLARALGQFNDELSFVARTEAALGLVCLPPWLGDRACAEAGFSQGPDLVLIPGALCRPACNDGTDIRFGFDREGLFFAAHGQGSLYFPKGVEFKDGYRTLETTQGERVMRIRDGESPVVIRILRGGLAWQTR